MAANIFLVTIGDGLARASRHSHDEWSVEFLLPDQDVRCLATGPVNPHVIYAGTQGNGVLRSHDGGKTWHAAGLTGQFVKALPVSSVSPGTVYAGTKSSKSVNGIPPMSETTHLNCIGRQGIACEWDADTTFCYGA